MNKKILVSLISLLIIILILGITFYFFYVNKSIQVNVIKTTPQSQKTTLDDRFLILYGKISKIDTGFLNIEIIKDPTLTDHVFDDMNKIDVLIDNNTVIKKFNFDKQIYDNLQITDIKIGDFVTVYIDNATSSRYKAIGVGIFDKNII